MPYNPYQLFTTNDEAYIAFLWLTVQRVTEAKEAAIAQHNAGQQGGGYGV